MTTTTIATAATAALDALDAIARTRELAAAIEEQAVICQVRAELARWHGERCGGRPVARSVLEASAPLAAVLSLASLAR